jgi:hypothetical protein
MRNEFDTILRGYIAICDASYRRGINPLPLIRSDLRHRGIGHVRVNFIRPMDDIREGICVMFNGRRTAIEYYQDEDILSLKEKDGMYKDYIKYIKEESSAQKNIQNNFR